MEPASAIIEKCGGVATVASWLSCDRSWVLRWTYAKPQGTGGQIPRKHIAELIRKARENGKDLSLEDVAPDLAEVAQ